MYRYLAPWFQDDWRVSKRLTINLGFRWDFNVPPYERHNRLDRGFNFTETSPVQSLIANEPVPFAGFPTLMGGLRFARRERPAAERRRYLYARGTAADRLRLPDYAKAGDARRVRPLLRQPQQQLSANHWLRALPRRSWRRWITGFRRRPPNMWNNPFPNGIAAPLGSSLGALTYVGQSMSGGAGYFVPGQGVVNPKPLLPRIKQFSLGFQYQLPLSSRIEASFVGNRGTNMESNLPVNNDPLSMRKQCNQLEGGDAQLLPGGVTPTTCDKAYTNPFFGLAPFKGTTDYTAPTLALSTLDVAYPRSAASTS